LTGGFMVENVRTGTQQRAFIVLGSYGYPAKGRQLGVGAARHARATDWEASLRSLDTTVPPRLVITDGADEIGTAVRATWPAHPGPLDRGPGRSSWPSVGLPWLALLRAAQCGRTTVLLGLIRNHLSGDDLDPRYPHRTRRFPGSLWV
jgi:hypothetical protein